MLRLHAHRRLVSVLTLLLLFAPVGVMAGTALSGATSHQHMHHDNHGATVDATTLEDVGHDRMLCSVVVPCEHGFCAGLAFMQTDSQGLNFGDVWYAGLPSSAQPVSPKSFSPPPRPLS